MLPVSAEINESDPGQEQKNPRPIATSAMDPVHSLGLIQPSTEHLQLSGFGRAAHTHSTRALGTLWLQPGASVLAAIN